MSIFGVVAGKNDSLVKMKRAISYAWDLEKSSDEFFFCANVRKQHAYEDMLFLKEIYCKTGGREYIHAFLSFEEDFTLEHERKILHDAVLDILKIWDGDYQIIAGGHFNTRHTHIHLVWNSVSIKTGKKYSSSKKDLMILKGNINEVLKKYGLSEIIGKLKFINDEIYAQKDVDFEHEISILPNKCYDVQYDQICPFYIEQPIYMETKMEEKTEVFPFIIEPIYIASDYNGKEKYAEEREEVKIPFLLEPFWINKGEED